MRQVYNSCGRIESMASDFSLLYMSNSMCEEEVEDTCVEERRGNKLTGSRFVFSPSRVNSMSDFRLMCHKSMLDF